MQNAISTTTTTTTVTTTTATATQRANAATFGSGGVAAAAVAVATNASSNASATKQQQQQQPSSTSPTTAPKLTTFPESDADAGGGVGQRRRMRIFREPSTSSGSISQIVWTPRRFPQPQPQLSPPPASTGSTVSDESVVELSTSQNMPPRSKLSSVSAASLPILRGTTASTSQSLSASLSCVAEAEALDASLSTTASEQTLVDEERDVVGNPLLERNDSIDTLREVMSIDAEEAQMTTKLPQQQQQKQQQDKPSAEIVCSEAIIVQLDGDNVLPHGIDLDPDQRPASLPKAEQTVNVDLEAIVPLTVSVSDENSFSEGRPAASLSQRTNASEDLITFESPPPRRVDDGGQTIGNKVSEAAVILGFQSSRSANNNKAAETPSIRSERRRGSLTSADEPTVECEAERRKSLPADFCFFVEVFLPPVGPMLALDLAAEETQLPRKPADECFVNLLFSSGGGAERDESPFVRLLADVEKPRVDCAEFHALDSAVRASRLSQNANGSEADRMDSLRVDEPPSVSVREVATQYSPQPPLPSSSSEANRPEGPRAEVGVQTADAAAYTPVTEKSLLKDKLPAALEPLCVEETFDECCDGDETPAAGSFAPNPLIKSEELMAEEPLHPRDNEAINDEAMHCSRRRQRSSVDERIPPSAASSVRISESSSTAASAFFTESFNVGSTAHDAAGASTPMAESHHDVRAEKTPALRRIHRLRFHIVQVKSLTADALNCKCTYHDGRCEASNSSSQQSQLSVAVKFDANEIFHSASVASSENCIFGEESACEMPERFNALHLILTQCWEGGRVTRPVGRVSVRDVDLLHHADDYADVWLPIVRIGGAPCTKTIGDMCIDASFDAASKALTVRVLDYVVWPSSSLSSSGASICGSGSFIASSPGSHTNGGHHHHHNHHHHQQHSADECGAAGSRRDSASTIQQFLQHSLGGFSASLSSNAPFSSSAPAAPSASCAAAASGRLFLRLCVSVGSHQFTAVRKLRVAERRSIDAVRLDCSTLSIFGEVSESLETENDVESRQTFTLYLPQEAIDKAETPEGAGNAESPEGESGTPQKQQETLPWNLYEQFEQQLHRTGSAKLSGGRKTKVRSRLLSSGSSKNAALSVASGASAATTQSGNPLFLSGAVSYNMIPNGGCSTPTLSKKKTSSARDVTATAEKPYASPSASRRPVGVQAPKPAASIKSSPSAAVTDTSSSVRARNQANGSPVSQRRTTVGTSTTSLAATLEENVPHIVVPNFAATADDYSAQNSAATAAPPKLRLNVKVYADAAFDEASYCGYVRVPLEPATMLPKDLPIGPNWFNIKSRSTPLFTSSSHSQSTSIISPQQPSAASHLPHGHHKSIGSTATTSLASRLESGIDFAVCASPKLSHANASHHHNRWLVNADGGCGDVNPSVSGTASAASSRTPSVASARRQPQAIPPAGSSTMTVAGLPAAVHSGAIAHFRHASTPTTSSAGTIPDVGRASARSSTGSAAAAFRGSAATTTTSGSRSGNNGKALRSAPSLASLRGLLTGNSHHHHPNHCSLPASSEGGDGGGNGGRMIVTTNSIPLQQPTSSPTKSSKNVVKKKADGTAGNGAVLTNMAISAEKIGEMRLRLWYSVDEILPLVHYLPLYMNLINSLTTKPYSASLTSLLQYLPIDMENIAKPLMKIFVHANQIRPFFRLICTQYVSSCHDVNTLFRSQSMASKVMYELMKFVGHDYLVISLKPLIDLIYAERKCCEIDPSKLKTGDSLEHNLRNITVYAELAFSRVVDSYRRCPRVLCEVFAELREVVQERFPGRDDVARLALSSFLIMRFFAAAILNPKLFALKREAPDADVSRTLVLVSKILQRLANCVVSAHPLTTKEQWLTPVLLRFLDDAHKSAMIRFLDGISTFCDNGSLGGDDDINRSTTGFGANNENLYPTDASPVLLKHGHMIERRSGSDKTRSFKNLIHQKRRYVTLTDTQLSWQKVKDFNGPLVADYHHHYNNHHGGGIHQPAVLNAAAEASADHRGHFALSEITSVSPLAEAKNSFRVATPYNEVHFQASSLAEMNEWLILIQKQQRRHIMLLNRSANDSSVNASSAANSTSSDMTLPPYEVELERQLQSIHAHFCEHYETLCQWRAALERGEPTDALLVQQQPPPSQQQNHQANIHASVSTPSLLLSTAGTATTARTAAAADVLNGSVGSTNSAATIVTTRSEEGSSATMIGGALTAKMLAHTSPTTPAASLPLKKMFQTANTLGERKACLAKLHETLASTILAVQQIEDAHQAAKSLSYQMKVLQQQHSGEGSALLSSMNGTASTVGDIRFPIFETDYSSGEVILLNAGSNNESGGGASLHRAQLTNPNSGSGSSSDGSRRAKKSASSGGASTAATTPMAATTTTAV